MLTILGFVSIWLCPALRFSMDKELSLVQLSFARYRVQRFHSSGMSEAI